MGNCEKKMVSLRMDRREGLFVFRSSDATPDITEGRKLMYYFDFKLKDEDK